MEDWKYNFICLFRLLKELANELYLLLEHVILKVVLNNLEANNIFTDDQCGFRQSQSYETALVSFVDELLHRAVADKQTNAITMEFSRTFDMVPNNSLT